MQGNYKKNGELGVTLGVISIYNILLILSARHKKSRGKLPILFFQALLVYLNQ